MTGQRRRSSRSNPSASSTASSTTCRRSGTRRSSGRWIGASTCTAARAWARSVPPSSTHSAWKAWARSSSRYRDGTLEDDDEVAVVHGAADSGYRPMSDSMVNIRYTLREAERSGVIGSRARATLEAIAKAQFFPERSYRSLVAAADGRVDPAELAAFAAWWPAGRVDLKRADAVAMLRLMRARHASPAPGQDRSLRVPADGVLAAPGRRGRNRRRVRRAAADPSRARRALAGTRHLCRRTPAARESADAPDPRQPPRTRWRLIDAMKIGATMHGPLSGHPRNCECWRRPVSRITAKSMSRGRPMRCSPGISRTATGRRQVTSFSKLARANWDEFLRALVRERLAASLSQR